MHDKTMDEKLRSVERLYGENASNEPVDAREERVLSDAKFVMDHRARQRPSPDTIDRIVAYAADQRVEPAPIKPIARIVPLFSWRAAVAAAVLLFAAGIVYLQVDLSPGPRSAQVDVRDDVRDELQARGLRANAEQAAVLEAATDSIPAWDEPTGLRLVQRRIEMLRASGQDLEWGEPVPLEQLPAVGTTPGIRAAGAGDDVHY